MKLNAYILYLVDQLFAQSNLKDQQSMLVQYQRFLNNWDPFWVQYLTYVILYQICQYYVTPFVHYFNNIQNLNRKSRFQQIKRHVEKATEQTHYNSNFFVKPLLLLQTIGHCNLY